MRRVFPVFLILILCSSACVFSEPGGSTTNNQTDNDAGSDADGGTDVANDTSDDGEGSGDAERDADTETCEPITECREDQCGTVDDGCGGTLECATQCPCVGGEPQKDTCGSCGLGVLECDADEDGFGTCVTPPLPEPLACEDVLYVNTESNADRDGSASSPFATYVSAFAEASAGQIIVIGGSEPVESMVEVRDGVSIYGGYDVQGDTWVFQPETKQAVDAPASQTGDTYGLAAVNLTEKTTVYGLDVATADASGGESYNNYGAYVVGTDALTLEFVDVFAGRGGSGADGSPGSAGADGTDGADAPKAHEGCGLCANGPVLNQTDAGDPGENNSCPDANGGAGGVGGMAGVGSVGGEDAHDGAEALQADGGLGGDDSAGSYGGEDGQTPAGFSQTAAHGDAAQPGGSVVEGLAWVPSGVGEDGADGAFGSGGGGGGGASYNTADGYDVGPGGAGGGAGGCGGAGGEGGGPGGGSFGLFTVDSDLTLVRARFSASAGGKGGAGASGGAGGQGGDGGLGTNEMEDYGGDANTSTTVNLPYSSGDGGDGADGQDGGWGAGGAGGVSYGAYCSGSSLQTDDVEFNEGAIASGGSSVGNDGPDGIAADTEGCE